MSNKKTVKPASQKKATTVFFRLTNAEKRSLVKAARAKKLILSEYCRQVLLGEPAAAVTSR